MPHFFMVLFLVLMCFFIPIVTFLNKVTVISYLDDSNSQIGLLVHKYSLSTLLPQYGLIDPCSK